MRIAQAIALYAPEFRGGATLVCERLAGELAARGHVVDVFSGRTTAAEPLGAVRRDRVGDAVTWRVNLGPAFQPWVREGWDDRVATDSFASFLEVVRPDVVHAHSVQALGAGIFAAAAAAGVQVVWTMHDWWWLCPCLFRLSPDAVPCSPMPRPERCFGRAEPDFAARREAMLRTVGGVSRVLVPSRYLRESLVANGLPAARVAVQENGIPRPEPRPPRRRDGRPLSVAYVGGAGNREKGLGVLLAAAARIARRDVVIHLHSVDPGEVAALALGGGGGARVECHPPFAPAELDGVLADADVAVVPSLMRESCSLVTREALLRAVPVVTSDCGGPEEVVRHGENGLVVPTGAAGALAEALERLAADAALLAHLSSAPPPDVPTPADQARAAEAVYREVLREAARGGRSAPGEISLPGSRADAAAGGALRGRRVVFLAGIDGAPLRYRVWHLVEQLDLLGVAAHVLYHSDVDALAACAAADCIVLYRAPFSAMVARVVAEARARAVPVVFSADDLVFDADACDAAALEDPRPDVARGFRWTLDAYGRSLAAADAFLGSTEELVDAARATGAPAWLHRNGLGRPLVAALDAARRRRIAADDAAAPARRADGDAPVRVGFLSGTDTHDRDLNMIAPALRRALDRLPRLRLVLGGPVAVPAELAAATSRIERIDFAPWSEFADRLAALDVSLAPLEPQRRFNEAKSEVKLLEAAVAGVATVASPTRAFRIASRDGAIAHLAASAAEWEDAIVRLAGDPDHRAALARRARRDVVARYGPYVQAVELAAVLEEILARGPRRDARPLPAPIDTDGGEGSRVALEPPASAYAAWQLAAEAAVPLAAGATVEQELVCGRDGLWRLDVRVGTCWRRNRGAVVARVLDDGGAVLATRSLDAATMVDGAWAAIELDAPLAESRGRRLRLRLESTGAGPGDEILLWHGPSAEGGLRLDGRNVPGRGLAYRGFAEEVG